jgi:ferredoxin
MLYIDPVACIQCRACVPVCPVEAIYDEPDLPQELANWVEINAERAAVLPTIEEKQTPLRGVG